MDDLKELVSIVSPNRIKQIRVFGSQRSKGSMVNQLYDGIHKGKWKNDDEIANYFYPKDPNQKNYFHKLRHKLWNKLIDTFFLVNLNPTTEIRKSFLDCYKKAAVAKILIGLGFKKSGIKIAENILPKAIKYDFTDAILMLVTELHLHYGAITGIRAKKDKYANILNHYLQVQQKEIEAQMYYTDLAFNFTNSRTTTSEISDLAKKYAFLLEPSLATIHSYKFNLYAYNIMVTSFQAENDYENVIITCSKAVEFFTSRSYQLPYPAYFSFLFKMIPSHIQLQQYKKAATVIERCLDLPPKGSYNWHVTLIYQVMLAFHSGEFQLAYDALNKAKTNTQFVYENIQEQWLIIEAFIKFFIDSGKIEPKEGHKKFRLGKFLNEVPIFSKDKRGNNISILIIQILFLLKQHKRDKIIDRTEALKSYAHRYLRRDETFRSNCFIKMLLQLPASHFNKIALDRKAKPYYALLLSKPIDIARQGSEIEIVPYEQLWEYILELL